MVLLLFLEMFVVVAAATAAVALGVGFINAHNYDCHYFPALITLSFSFEQLVLCGKEH